MPGVVDPSDGVAGRRLEQAETRVVRWQIHRLEVADRGPGTALFGADPRDVGDRGGQAACGTDRKVSLDEEG